MKSSEEISRQAYIIKEAGDFFPEYFKIFVKAFTNKILTLKVKNEDHIASIKKQIEHLEQIELSYQRLIFMGIEMTDDQFIAEYNIQEGSTIICESNVLLATSPDGKIATFPVGSDDTMDQVKQRISQTMGIPKTSQRIFYSCCSFRGKQLDDSKTISDNKIGGNLVHVLTAVQSKQIFVEILESTRTIVNIPVTMTDTIFQIKGKIQEYCSQNIMQYKLFIQDNEMNDNNSLAHYKIKDESVLQLCEDKIIYVKRLSGEKFKLRVNRFDTIEQVKIKIEQKIDVPLKLQTLYFHNTELNNSKTLADYDVGFGMKVELKTGIRVFVSSSFTLRMIFELQTSDTIRTLKEAIKAKIGVLEDHQRIVHDSIELHDQWKCFKEDEELELLICSGNNLFLKVFVDESLHIVEAIKSDDTQSLKKKVEEKIGKSMGKYCCYFQNNQLKNNVKLGDSGVTNMSVLQLSESGSDFLSVNIKTMDGFERNLLVNKLDTIKFVKIKIDNLLSMPPDQQRLIFAGEQLEDGKTIQDYNIRDGSTITVVHRLRGC